MLTLHVSLILQAQITTAADDIRFSEKIRLDVSSESSARQRIHIKNQAFLSLKDKSKKNKMSSAAIFVWRFKVLIVQNTLRPRT